MARKNITVVGNVFSCPVAWRVEEAHARIRSTYVLCGRHIAEDDEPLLGETLIGSTVGDLSFVGTHSTLEGESFVNLIL